MGKVVNRVRRCFAKPLGYPRETSESSNGGGEKCAEVVRDVDEELAVGRFTAGSLACGHTPIGGIELAGLVMFGVQGLGELDRKLLEVYVDELTTYSLDSYPPKSSSQPDTPVRSYWSARIKINK